MSRIDKKYSPNLWVTDTTTLLSEIEIAFPKMTKLDSVSNKEKLTKNTTPHFDTDFFNPLLWDVTEFTKNGLEELIFKDKTSCNGYDGYKAIECLIAMHISDSIEYGKIKLPLTDDSMRFDVPWA